MKLHSEEWGLSYPLLRYVGNCHLWMLAYYLLLAAMITHQWLRSVFPGYNNYFNVIDINVAGFSYKRFENVKE